MFFATSLLVMGLILLVYGADRLVYSAAALSRTPGFAPGLIGSGMLPAANILSRRDGMILLPAAIGYIAAYFTVLFI